MLGTSSVSCKQAKRKPSKKPDHSSQVTLHDLTVQLAKTQVRLRSYLEEPVVFTKGAFLWGDLDQGQ